jgi:BirA family biotin operon repressor/biotin-[acetyl-CoA-carboxylase] ligase
LNLITLPVVDSTNSHALRLLDQGLASEGTVVMAWEQTSGRGQRGSSWSSQPGQGLYFSLILTPPAGILPQVAVLIKALTLGVTGYILSRTGMQPCIKWPNDILIGERKICGILMESVIKGDSLSAIVVGIGINLNHKSFSEDFSRQAVSMHQLTQENYNPEEEVSAVVKSVMQAYRGFLQNGEEEVELKYNALLYGKDLNCSFLLNGEGIQALFLGVNSKGEAVIDFEGKIQHFPHPFLRLTKRTG